MADIKTRDVVKGTIKKIDKAAIAADRMRSAYVQTKEKAEHTTHPDEHNAEEYASDRVEGGVDRITHEVAHQFDKQGRKGLEETKRNVSKAKDGVQRFREKRVAESMKRQTVRTSGNKTIKAVEQTEKTINSQSRTEVGQDHENGNQDHTAGGKDGAENRTGYGESIAKSCTSRQSRSQGNSCRCKSCRESNDCRSQSNHSGDKSTGRCYRRRRLGCRCGHCRNLPDCSDLWLGFRDILFRRGFRNGNVDADCCAGNQR